MKHLISVVLFLALACSVHGSETLSFNNDVYNQPVPITITVNKTIKIATLYPDQQESDYWRRNLISMQARLEALRIPYTLKHYSSKPDQLHLQEKQLIEALAAQPDFLIVGTDSPIICKLLGRILYRGHPQVIIINQTIPCHNWDSYPPLLYTGFDDVLGSEMLASFLFDRFGKNARYVVIYGSDGDVSRFRGEGLHRAATKRNAATPLAEYYTDIEPEKAYNATIDILKRYPELDFIFCITTDIALNTAKALKAMGRSKSVLINGWGGGQAELDALVDGRLALTVMRMNDDSGISIAEALKYALESREEEIPAVFSGKLELVSPAILPQIEALKKQAFRYSEI